MASVLFGILVRLFAQHERLHRQFVVGRADKRRQLGRARAPARRSRTAGPPRPRSPPRSAGRGSPARSAVAATARRVRRARPARAREPVRPIGIRSAAGRGSSKNLWVYANATAPVARDAPGSSSSPSSRRNPGEREHDRRRDIGDQRDLITVCEAGRHRPRRRARCTSWWIEPLGGETIGGDQHGPGTHGTHPITAYDRTGTWQRARWSSTMPVACISAYAVVGPTNLKPRLRRSFASAIGLRRGRRHLAGLLRARRPRRSARTTTAARPGRPAGRARPGRSRSPRRSSSGSGRCRRRRAAARRRL